MKINELKVPSRQDRKRVGRGIGSGTGKTAGRGTKGQNARSGGKVRPGFEGGQNPLMQRIPKVRGFNKPSARINIVHTDQLNRFKKGTVTKAELAKFGLVTDLKHPVKLLFRGDVKEAIKIEVDSASKKARAAVEASGGSLIKA